MRSQWSALVFLVIFSTNAFAESIKREIRNTDIKVCPEKESFNLIDVSGGDRLKFASPEDSKDQQEYTFYIGDYKSSDVNRGDPVVIVTIEESRRKSRIVEDIAKVFEYAKGQAKAGIDKGAERLAAVVEVPQPQCVTYKSAYKRSTISVQGSIPVQWRSNGEPKLSINRSLIAGPKEHWSLSADLPITNVKQLTYDSNTASVVEKDKPTSFYIGVNFKVGDVYTNYDYLDLNNLSGKFLFKASSSPNDSMGVGVGYSFKFVELFYVRVWTRDDVSTGKTNLGTTPSNIYGVSLNISKGISWLQGD